MSSISMNLVVDIGNSRIKTAVFDNGNNIHDAIIEPSDFIPSLQQLRLDFPGIRDLIVSPVGKMKKKWVKFLQENFTLMKFSTETPVPFKNLYETPKTLGLDRIALVAAAQRRYPQKNVLIVDAGTCITYDFLNKKGEYLGGAISPGIQMRFQSLHTFTENLPLIETTDQTNFMGRSTAASIKTGVLTGSCMEINGFIAHYLENFKDLTIILTGGDGLLLSTSIKNSIFAPSNFLLEGLNTILEYNKTP